MTECYLINCTTLPDPGEIPSSLEGIAEERAARILRFRMAADRRRGLAAGMLIRDVLPRYGITQDMIVIDAMGRPRVSDPSLPDFNLSHSGDYVLLAVSDRSIGCDLEQIQEVSPSLQKRVCTERERTWIAGLPEEEQRGAFFRIWTGRESYTKMTGEGISIEFDEYEILPMEDVETERVPGTGNAPKGLKPLTPIMSVHRSTKKEDCHIWQSILDDQYVISVCMKSEELIPVWNTVLP